MTKSARKLIKWVYKDRIQETFEKLKTKYSLKENGESILAEY